MKKELTSKYKKNIIKKLNYNFLSSDISKNLIGGFSNSVSKVETTIINDGSSNNCLGGNCTYACSNQQNDKCNAHAGCG